MKEDTGSGSQDWGINATPWTSILGADDPSSQECVRQLSFLAERYWKPVHFFIQRRGKSPGDATGLTHSLFSIMLQKEFLDKSDPSRASLRTYLREALPQYLSSDLQDAFSAASTMAQQTLFLTPVVEEAVPDEAITAEEEFDRQWAYAVVNQVLRELKVLCEREGEQLGFQVLSRRLVEGELPSYGATRTLSLELGVEPEALEKAYHKSLHWYRNLFRQEVRAYVSTDNKVEEEIRGLWKAVH